MSRQTFAVRSITNWPHCTWARCHHYKTESTLWPTESTISNRDVVLLPGLLPIFLHGWDKIWVGLGDEAILNVQWGSSCRNVQSGSSQSPMLSERTIKYAVIMFPMYTVHFHQCGTLTWAWSILQTTPLLYSPQVSATPHNWELLLNTWERKRQKKFATCPCTKIEYFHQHPEYFSCSSAVPSPLVTQVTQCKGCKLRNACRCVHASTLTIIKWPQTYMVCAYLSSLGTRPSKNRKGGSGTSAGVEVYTAPGMKVHFQLAFD